MTIEKSKPIQPPIGKPAKGFKPPQERRSKYNFDGLEAQPLEFAIGKHQPQRLRNALMCAARAWAKAKKIEIKINSFHDKQRKKIIIYKGIVNPSAAKEINR